MLQVSIQQQRKWWFKVGGAVLAFRIRQTYRTIRLFCRFLLRMHFRIYWGKALVWRNQCNYHASIAYTGNTSLAQSFIKACGLPTQWVRRGIALCNLRDTVLESSCTVSEVPPKVGSVVRMRCAATAANFEGNPGEQLSFQRGDVFVIKSLSPGDASTGMRIFATTKSFQWLWIPCDAMEVLEVAKSTTKKVG